MADSVPVTVAVDEGEPIIDASDASADTDGCAETDCEPAVDAVQTDETELDADGVAVFDPEALVVLLLVAVATADISFGMVADAVEIVVSVGEAETVDDSDAFDECDAVAELLPDAVDVMEMVALVDVVVVAEDDLDCVVVTVAVADDVIVVRAFEELPVEVALNVPVTVPVLELDIEPELVCENVSDVVCEIVAGTVDDTVAETVFVAVIEGEIEAKPDLDWDVETESEAVVVVFCAGTLNNSETKIIDRMWDRA